MDEISRLVPRLDVQQVVINPVKAGGAPGITLNNPISIQVEDAIANLLPHVGKATKPTKELRLMAQRGRQLQDTGMFTGQAAIVGDGYVVEV